MPELTIDADHVYRLDGVRIPGVTSVLQAVKLVDYSFLPWDVREEALARGRFIADLCALRLLRGPIKTTLLARLMNEHSDWMRYFVGFERFLGERPDVRPLLVEQKVFSVQHQYGGTLDLTAIFADKPALIDIKTGQAPKSAAYQTAAYALALDSVEDYEFTKVPHRRFALELHEDGTYKIIEYKRHSYDRQIWLAALSVFNEQEHREAA